MTVSGELRRSGERLYLVPRVSLRNIGNSKVTLIQNGSGYRIWKAPDAEPGREATWCGGKPVYNMFEAHGWIEPGETIFDEVRLIALDTASVATKVQARLVGRGRGFLRELSLEWNGSAIVGPDPNGKEAVMQREQAADYRLEQRPEDPQKSHVWEEDKDKYQDRQQPEDSEQTREWEDKQAEEDRERTREWEEDKE